MPTSKPASPHRSLFSSACTPHPAPPSCSAAPPSHPPPYLARPRRAPPSRSADPLHQQHQLHPHPSHRAPPQAPPSPVPVPVQRTDGHRVGRQIKHLGLQALAIPQREVGELGVVGGRGLRRRVQSTSGGTRQFTALARALGRCSLRIDAPWHPADTSDVCSYPLLACPGLPPAPQRAGGRRHTALGSPTSTAAAASAWMARRPPCACTKGAGRRLRLPAGLVGSGAQCRAGSTGCFIASIACISRDRKVPRFAAGACLGEDRPAGR